MSLSGEAKLAGVMGWPVSHSRSPRLHGFWLDKYGIDGAYLPLPVQPDTLEQALRALPVLGFAGCNLTLPLKERALDIMDRVSATARRIGAVNTVTVAGDGTLEGDNTDAFGFIENLRAGRGGWRADAGPAAVLGAGGAARAVCWGLLDAGCPEIRLTNRNQGRAEALAAALGPNTRVLPWPKRADALDGAALLVNATSLGMTGQPALELDIAALPGTAAVTDLVYAPLETPLLVMARNTGRKAVDGLGMLLHQARPGFEAWFGVAPAVDEALRRFVMADGA